MSQIVLTDAKIWVGGYDLSGFSNEAYITMTPAMLEATVFGKQTKVNTPGLHDFKANAGGFMDHALPMGAVGIADQLASMNSALFAKVGPSAPVDIVSFAPLGNAEQDLAYTIQKVASKFDPLGGAIGALVPYKLELEAAGVRLVRGTLMAKGSKIATGNTTAPLFVTGGILTGQRLYASIHVFGSSGTTPTIDVTIRSSTVIGMTAPTTRLTFPQFTTLVGASWQSIAGPITDQYFDVKWTVAGTTPSFNIAVIIGVL